MKKAIRNQYLLSRKGVLEKRRRHAEELVTEQLKDLVKDGLNILSYYPLSDEVNISSFNRLLESEGRLSLPKIVRESLVPYTVTNMEKQLKTFSHKFLEPDFMCKENLSIDIVIVPGIVFDKMGGRIGFGKGHYDKFLMGKKIMTIGVCFKEQMYDGILPLEAHDIAMERLCIV